MALDFIKKQPFALTILLALLLMACADNQPASRESLNSSWLIEVPGISKDSLYEDVKMWIAENFVSSKAVIEYDNKQAGVLIGNSALPGICNTTVAFTMKIQVRDGKFRVAFSNFRDAETSVPPTVKMEGKIDSAISEFPKEIQDYILNQKPFL